MRTDERFIKHLHDVLARNYRRRGFGISQIAEKMGISERHLQRRVSELAGCGPAQYLRAYRLQASLDYLRDGGLIGDVAHAVGFTSHAYFSSCFKSKFGTTPSRYREQSR